MAQNITLLGASYSDVPAVELPKTGGGTATFTDTSDANATASDIASGKTAYVNGTKIVGTASGGGGGVVITDTTDVHGGTIREITAVVLNNDTVTAASMLSGVTAHDASGTAITGSIATKTSSDLSASGDTVTVPSGYYASSASKAVSSGTAGTPTATKGAVNNHSISVTPSVKNTTGYITGSTITGTAVSVSASELVSGDLAISQNGNNIDVTDYATVSVSVGGTSKNTQIVQGTTRTTSSTMTAVGAELTVSKTGTYDIYWSAFRSSTSSSYTYATQLYIGGSAHGSENATWSNHVQNNHLSNVSLTANQTVRVYGRNSRGSSYYIYAPMLAIVEN